MRETLVEKTDKSQAIHQICQTSTSHQTFTIHGITPAYLLLCFNEQIT